MDNNVDGELIRELRLEKSWSQEDLAERAGLSLRTVQRVESDGLASLRSRRSIAHALEVSPTDLVAQKNTTRYSVGSKPIRILLRGARWLALILVWGMLSLSAVIAFTFAFGGVFFWEYGPLSHSQMAGGGLLMGAIFLWFFFLLRRLGRKLNRIEVVVQA